MKNIALILISAAIVLAFRPDLVNIFRNENNTDEKPPAVPSRVLREVVAPIRGTALNRSDARRLAEFYLALADVVERDEAGIIRTSAEVRLINERSGRLCFEKTGIAGRYPGLAAEIDTVIAHGIGGKRIDGKWESVEITHENRGSLAESLRAIAWACGR